MSARTTTNNNNNINHVDDEEDKLFFTRSDLIERLNSSLASYDACTLPTMDGENGNEKPRFELQKRLPDGSAISADNTDIAAADFQDKVKQAAAVISSMSDDEKLNWAKQQRQHGNRFFQNGDYKKAMDIYMTCLVAMNPACFDQNTESQTTYINDSTNDESITHHPSTAVIVDKSQRELLLPVLLNLSLCTLKLGMFKKTERFCDFAIEAPCGRENAKVYFRRGKARMLMGSYNDAKDDLQNSLRLVTEEISMIDPQSPSSSSSRKVTLSKEKESIIREIKKLKKLTKEAELNSKRQRNAMRRILGGEKSARFESKDQELKVRMATNKNEIPIDNTLNRIPKDDDDDDTSLLYKNTQSRRPYSTLTAPDLEEQAIFDTWFRNKDPLHQTNNNIAVSFIRSFLSVFENCLRTTLYFLGDEDAMTRSFDDELDGGNEQRKIKIT